MEDICKEKRLNCRAGDPCEIRCDAKATCSAGTIIDASASTDVTIICDGDDACKDDINIKCGTGNCQLQCQGRTSCIDWGKIDVSKSKSFQCIGNCPQSLPSPFIRTESPTSNPTTMPTRYPTRYPTMIPTTSPTTGIPNIHTIIIHK